VHAEGRYQPNPKNKAAYDRNYDVFIKLYKSNCEHFAALNGATKERRKEV
jgi:sugar (pentulose or hexulose) kinase